MFPADIRNFARLFEISDAAALATAEMQAILMKAVALPDASPLMMKKTAEIYLTRNDILNAIKWYQRYTEKSPDDYAAWFTIGSLFFDKKEYTAAIDPLTKALKGMPEDNQLLYRLALCRKNAGITTKNTADVQEAIGLLIKVHNLNAKNAAVYVPILAECYRYIKDAKKLADALKEWRALDPRNFDILQELGSVLMQEGMDAEAIEAFEAAVTLKPQEGNLHLNLAGLYEKKGDAVKRIEHLSIAAQYAPSNVDILRELARSHAALKEYVKAENEYLKLISLLPQDAPVIVEYAQVLRTQNKNQAALQYLEKVIKIEAKNPAYLFLYSKIAKDAGQTNLAVKAARRAASLDPTNAEIIAWTGYIFTQIGRADSARVYLEMAVVLNSKCSDCYQMLGDSYLADGKFKNAADAYASALSSGQPNTAIAIRLGRVYEFCGQYTQARDAFQQAVSASPTSDEARYRLIHSLVMLKETDRARAIKTGGQAEKKSGWIHMIEGALKEADNALDAAYLAYSIASRMLPEAADPEAGCGRVKFKKKEFSTAIEFFGKAMAKDPYNLEYYLAMAQAYEKINEDGSASALYLEIIQKQPTFPGIYEITADALIRQKDFNEAIKVIKDGLSNNPQNAGLYFKLGEQYREIDKPKTAIAAYNEALKIDAKSMNEANRHIGLLYFDKLLDNESALKYLKKYQKNGGTKPDVDAAIKRVEKLK
jgi:tetratricopeptide (TPR) repeat protein